MSRTHSSSQLMMIQTRSPLHCGTGHARGAVDLPIARESVSELPYIPATGLKGALRNAALDARLPHKEVSWLFGPSASEVDRAPRAGEISFGDASLVCLPVSSLKGVFAYVSCPHLLERLKLDLETINVTSPALPYVREGAYLSKESLLTLEGTQAHVTLSEYDLHAQEKSEATAWAELIADLLSLKGAEREQLTKRFCVVSDDSFKTLAERSLEVNVRVSLNRETRTASDGALWTEENLPRNTILASLSYLTPNQRSRSASQGYEQLTEVVRHEVQIGGNATVGRGRCKLNFYGGAHV